MFDASPAAALTHPFWKYCSQFFRSVNDFVTHGSLAHDALRVLSWSPLSAPQLASIRLSNSRMRCQLSLPPMVMALVPDALSFWASASISSNVVGGLVMPAFSNSFLL